MNHSPTGRLEIIKNLDVEAAKAQAKRDGNPLAKAPDRVVLIALHKMRAEFARNGDLPFELGDESSRWLIQRGYRHYLPAVHQ